MKKKKNLACHLSDEGCFVVLSGGSACFSVFCKAIFCYDIQFWYS